jgi:hypothetical protein
MGNQSLETFKPGHEVIVWVVIQAGISNTIQDA